MLNNILIIVVSFLIIYISLRFFSLKKYIDNHKKLFRSGDKFSSGLFFTYNFLIPSILTYLTLESDGFNENIINMITISLSILTAMLFTMLALLLDKVKDISENNKVSGSKNQIVKNVIRETYYTIMYNIFISCILLMMLFIYYAVDVKMIILTIIYFLLYTFLLNLILILSNIYNIFKHYIDI